MVEFRHKEAIGKNGEDMLFTIASGPVIIEENKVLLNKHDDPFYKFPGGSVQSKDNLEEACKREVKEENNIEIEITNKEPCILCFDRDYKGKREFVILVHYLAKKKSGVLKPGKDIEDSKFFPLNNLPKDLAPNIKPVLDFFKKKGLL
ncbi:NUDIX domain-containing protein [Candidatus Woesearchaeota archaeon]|nr:NUDIX domain-containing protein [Candidatus Woesearchaeota archaeon]